MESDPDLWTYLLLERLPTSSECVQAIVSVSPLFGSKKQKDVVHQFATILHGKSFTDQYVVILRTVKMKLTSHLKNYSSKVQKAKGSKRKNMKNWFKESNELFDLLNKTANPKYFEQSEKDFYYDQKSLTRKIGLSTEIDVEYESKVEQEQLNMQELFMQEKMEVDFIYNSDEEVTVLNSTLCDPTDSNSINLSLNPSGMTRQTKSMVDSHTQTDGTFNSSKTLRPGVRNFDESIKSALALS